jgi:hypothetical protein
MEGRWSRMIQRSLRQLLNRQSNLREKGKENITKNKPNDFFPLITLNHNKKSKRNHIREIKAIITISYSQKIKKV